MDKNYLVGKNVDLGRGALVGDFVSLGVEKEELPLAIGRQSLIRSHSVIYGGSTIGHHFQSGHHVLIREGSQIGDEVSIGSLTVIEHHVKIGNRVRIHSGAFVPEFSILDDDCWLGPHVVLTNAKYPRSPRVKKELVGPHLKQGAKIGANATILPGIIIGEKALVGAGSVVTKNVPDRSVVAGNPAIVINTLNNLPYV